MGIPIELFVCRDGLEDLSCVICQQVFDDPHFIGCDEQHAFCHDCLIELHDHNTNYARIHVVCPCCRQSVSVNKSLAAPFLRRLVQKHPISCTFNCGWQGYLTDNHKDLCSLRLVGCLNENCDWSGTFVDSESHDRECEFGLVDCERDECHVKLIRKDTKLHNAVCKGYKCVYSLRDGCPFVGDFATHAIHLRYCQGIHDQLSQVDSQADGLEDETKNHLTQLRELELKLATIYDLAQHQGVDLRSIASPTRPPHSTNTDLDLDDEPDAEDDDEDDAEDGGGEDSEGSDGDEEDEGEGGEEDESISESEQEELRNGNSQATGSSEVDPNQSPAVLIPSAIEKLAEIAKPQQTSVDHDFVVTALSPPPPPTAASPAPGSLPFNLTNLRPSASSVSATQLKRNLVAFNSVGRGTPRALVSMKPSLAEPAAPTAATPLARGTTWTSPSDYTAQGGLTGGPFNFTSIGRGRLNGPTHPGPARSLGVVRRASGAGLSSGGRTPRAKRSKTVESDQAQAEPRGRWEKDGRMMPEFGGGVLSD